MKRAWAGLAGFVALAACGPGAGDVASSGPDAEACIPAGMDRAGLDERKARGFIFEDAEAAGAFAVGITGCLASVDPGLRDGIAYESLARVLRRGDVSKVEVRAIRDQLYAMLDGADAAGVARPFAALGLSEVARTDRVEAWMEANELAAMVDRAVAFEAGVEDYRGFVDGEGWRHGVAHGADWLLQLTLNGRMERGELEAMRDAVAAQVSPAGHAFVFGESDRLARVIYFMSQRDEFSADEWSDWLLGVSGPGPVADWEDAFGLEAGLAHRHNVRAFLSALLVLVVQNEQRGAGKLERGVTDALEQIP